MALAAAPLRRSWPLCDRSVTAPRLTA